MERPNYPIRSKAGRVTGLPFTDEDRDMFARIITGLGLTGAWAWGSRTRGWWVPESDWDLLVPTDSAEETRRLTAAARGLSETLGIKIDLFFNHPAYADAVWVEAAPIGVPA